MARIAYVDHSFHRRTLSTEFLPEMLRRRGHQVDTFWDDSWQGGNAVEWDAVRGHDAVVMFQTLCPSGGRYHSRIHPNVTYIPMLDQWALWKRPTKTLARFWEPLQGCKVLNFSTAAHALAVGLGLCSLCVRYYPAPLDRPTAPAEGLHGFFWLRREDQISWRTLAPLVAGTRFDSLHLHVAVDPGSPTPKLPTEEQRRSQNITLSQWFKEKADFTRALERANVFFAPRLGEGIGQSFLEAFSRGQCVVAVDHGTMNEYIIHGLNGLLYDPGNPQPLNFSRAVELGRAGWSATGHGHARFQQAEDEIVAFLLTPNSDAYSGMYDHFAGVNAPGRIRRPLMERVLEWPLVRKARPLWHPLMEGLRRAGGRNL